MNVKSDIVHSLNESRKRAAARGDELPEERIGSANVALAYHRKDA